MCSSTKDMRAIFVFVWLICGISDVCIEGATPKFDNTLQDKYTISEDTGAGVSVATVVFEDNDNGDVLSLDMIFNEYFSFTDNGDKTGTVKTHSTRSLGPGSGTTQELTFYARDLDYNVDDGKYEITISNKAPTITGLPSSAQVSEDTALQTSIFTITCTDPVDAVHSSLKSVTPSNSPKQEFFFVMVIPGSTSYGVYARAQTDPSQGSFNYNSQRSYALNIECSDGEDTSSGTLTVNLQQNQAPVITTPNLVATQAVSPTTTAGTVVYTLTATDNENDVITYTYTTSPNTDLFHVLASGAVQAKRSLSTETLASSYTLTITPNDAKNTGDPVTLILTISGGNNAPTFSNLNNAVSVNENSAVGTSVFEVTTADSDGDTLTLMMSSNPASGTSLFTLDAATKTIKTFSALNYESIDDKVYELYIVVSDGSASTTGTLTVTLANVNESPAWSANTYRANIAEGAAVGTTLMNTGLASTDPDVGDNRACFMSCVLPGYFSISTGCVITVASVYSLDAGLANSVTCTVRAVDSGGITATSTLSIAIDDENNFTPSFAPTFYSYVVSGYEAISTTLGTVTATDGDGGSYGDFSYSLNQDALTQTVLKINASSGLISTAISMENCNCTGSTWTVPVYATDQGGKIGTATVQVSVGVTTTILTTTTTDRHITFLEDPRNAAWFSMLLVGLVLGLFLTGIVLMTQVFDGTPSICRRRPHQSQRFYDEGYDNSDRGQAGDYGPMKDNGGYVRNPPPPIEAQSWRNAPHLY